MFHNNEKGIHSCLKRNIVGPHFLVQRTKLEIITQFTLLLTYYYRQAIISCKDHGEKKEHKLYHRNSTCSCCNSSPQENCNWNHHLTSQIYAMDILQIYCCNKSGMIVHCQCTLTCYSQQIQAMNNFSYAHLMAGNGVEVQIDPPICKVQIVAKITQHFVPCTTVTMNNE